MVWPAVIAAGASLAGSQISQNFNAKQTSKQMEFQERMANTQYQRAANDLEKAGLNRVLALGSPAAAPSGAASSISAPDLGASGIAAASAKQSIAQSKALEQAHKAQAQLNAQLARKTSAQADKEEITRAPYKAAAPIVEGLLNAAQPTFNSAKEAVESVPKIWKHHINKAKEAGSDIKDKTFDWMDNAWRKYNNDH